MPEPALPEAPRAWCQAIGHEGGADLIVVVAAGHLGHGLDMANVLSHKHKHNRDEHGKDGEIGLRQVELREADPCGVADGGEVDLTTDAGIYIADDHADQNIEATPASP